ncbi:unnamed protein product [Ectocarpus sp. 12 AP-2014]
MRLPAVTGLLGCVPAPGFVVPAVPIPSARFVGTGTTAGLTRAQQPRSATTAVALLMAVAGDSDNKHPWESFPTAMAKKAAVAAAIAAAVAFSTPGDALAADSGGRISGGSFSDSSYTSPCSTGPSSLQYQDFEEGGGMSDGTDLVLFCGTVGAAYGLDRGVEELEKRVTTRVGNLDDCPPSSRGKGVDVIKLQFAINCCDRGSNSILGVLEDVSARGDTGTRLGLADVVSEISFALGRRSSDWVASASELEHFDDPNTERAEATFSQCSVHLRAKIKRETKTLVGGKNISVQRSREEGSSASPGRPTVAVVCLVIALRGDALQRLGLDKNVNSSVSSDKRCFTRNEPFLFFSLVCCCWWLCFCRSASPPPRNNMHFSHRALSTTANSLHFQDVAPSYLPLKFNARCRC